MVMEAQSQEKQGLGACGLVYYSDLRQNAMNNLVASICIPAVCLPARKIMGWDPGQTLIL
jgi:hypothetical protein